MNNTTVKETIKISDISNGDDNFYEWPDYKVVFDDDICFDLGKKYAEKEVVVQRLADGKFFKFTYIYSDYHNHIQEQIAYEVEEKTRTITETYYE